MKSRAVSPWYTDKALFVALLSMALPPLSAHLGVQLDPWKVASMLSVAATYIAAHKAKSWSILKLELEQEAREWAERNLGPDASAAPTRDAAAIARTVTRALVLVLAVGALALPTQARAGGLDWSTGPSLPFLEYDFGKTHPVQVAPGAGIQVSITHDIFKRAVAGKSWDLLDLQLAGFGSVVSGTGGQEFGALSASVGVCTFSSLLCLGVGKHLLSADRSLVGGGWFMSLSLNFNVALAPSSPPLFVESGPAGLPRANTLYAVGF